MEISGSLVAVLLVTFLFWFLRGRRSRNAPPGPLGLPFVGYIPFMTSKPHLDLIKLAKKYGPVISLRLGSQTTIVLNDFESTKAAFAQDAFVGRPPIKQFQLTEETMETGAFHGPEWKEQRRFSLQMLKDLGFGKSNMEQFIVEEIQDLLSHFEKTGGEPSHVRPFLVPSMSNNISSLVFGKRLRYDDPVRLMMDRTLQQSAEAAGQVVWQIFFPGLADALKAVGLASSKMDEANKEMKNYIKEEIKEHVKTLDRNNIRDYIDGYLVEIEKKNDPAFCKGVLEDLIGAFFGAGSETVRLTVDWLMLTMAARQDVQAKVQAEVDSVVGRDRTPSWSDHPRMPYTQATIMELMRWRTIIPINPLRSTLWDTSLNGFTIPKHSYVMANLWAVHHDPELWGEDAEEFKPERFLSEDGKTLVKSPYFIPFSIGKRSCPGEFYARIEVFLYFASIFQRFRVTLPDGAVPDFEGVLGIGLAPKEHRLCIRKRFNVPEIKVDAPTSPLTDKDLSDNFAENVL